MNAHRIFTVFCIPVLFLSSFWSLAALETRVLYREDFEKTAIGAIPAAVKDNSSWAGTSCPLRVVDSGDTRIGKNLEAEVSGFAQIMLGMISSVEKGKIYRVSVSIASKGTQRIEVTLRQDISPYREYCRDLFTASESMQSFSFMSASGEDGRRVCILLKMNGVTTLLIDNVTVEEVIGELPPPAPPAKGNHIPNGGMELAMDGWFIRGDAYVIDTANAFEGKRAMLMSNGALVTSTWMRFSSEGEYCVRARVRSEAPAVLTIGMGNYIFPRPGSSGTNVQFDVLPNNGWRTVELRWRPSVPVGKIVATADYYFSMRAGSNSSVMVDAVEVKTVGSMDTFEPRAKEELAVFTDMPHGVATVGETVSVTVRSTAPTSARLTILDEDDKEYRSIPLSFTRSDAVVRLADMPCGYWRLVTVSDRKEAFEGETFLSVVPPMPPVSHSQWVAGTHVPESMPLVRTACAKLGLVWDRMHDTSKISKRFTVETAPGSYTFDDTTLAAMRRDGFSLLGSLEDKVPKDVSAEWLAGWEKYARETASHWKGAIDAWEIWNEPNLKKITPAQYCDILSAANRGVKAGNPDAFVVGLGGVAPLYSPWLFSAISNGAGAHCDAISFHGYGVTTWSTTTGPSKLIASAALIRSALSNAGTPQLELWDTEAGIAVDSSFRKFIMPPGGESDAKSGAYMLAKSLAAVKAAGLSRIFYYSAVGTTHAGDGGLRILTDFNNTMKITAVPLAVAVSLLEGRDFISDRSDGTSGIVHLVFKGRSSSVDMYWAPNHRARITPPSGTRRIVSVWGRTMRPTAAIDIDAAPVYCIGD
ncbi:MAG: hypothetical protein AABZ39_14675 [Spirochaetota bacterium]